MNLLLIGGGVFLGAATLQSALARDHRVSVFNRGRARSRWPKGVEVLIVGPGDTSGRFSHWPWRVLDGGTMLVPDVPAGEPLQFIDVRDLGDWMIALLEQGASGAYNATGPIGASACDWNTLIDACANEATARGVTPARVVCVSESFLAGQDVQPWTELTLWLPSGDAGYRGFSRVDLSRAVATGLCTRALRETIAAVMDEGVPAADDKRRTGRLTREREAALLETWARS